MPKLVFRGQDDEHAVIEEDIEYALSKHGEPLHHAPMPERTVEILRGRVPDFLIVFWQRFGQCSWFGGGFQVIDPLKYAGLFGPLLRDDPDFRAGEIHAFALGPFGQIEAWNERLRHMTFMTLPNWLMCSQLFKPRTVSPDISMGTIFSYADDHASDRDDIHGKPMFARLKKTHGPLPHDHVFAPRLHPALGGAQEVGNFRPASAPEAIALMHQAEPFVLIDTSTPAMRKVRPLGPQG